MKIVSAEMAIIIPMKSVRLQDGKFGGGGNLFITGNDRVPFWIVRVPKEIIWGHAGWCSDNSVAMLAAVFAFIFR